jgi:hypothetical protein
VPLIVDEAFNDVLGNHPFAVETGASSYEYGIKKVGDCFVIGWIRARWWKIVLELCSRFLFLKSLICALI